MGEQRDWAGRARAICRRRRRVAAVVVVASVLVPAAPAAALTDFTWSGASPTSGGDTNWSTAANWTNATAPSGSVGTLTFPTLSSASCTANPPTASCYSSNNDVSGLTAAKLAIDNSAPYAITGNSLTLGSGGIAATTSSANSVRSPSFNLPIALNATQSWTIDGANNHTQLGLFFSRGITGAGDALTVTLSNFGRITTAQDTEVGPLTIAGANPSDTGQMSVNNGFADLSGLNGVDGAAVNLADVTVAAPGSVTFGPLASTGAQLDAGHGSTPDAILTVSGGVTLDSASALEMFIDQPGTTPGTDYSQIKANGPVSLAGTLMLLGPGQGANTCPALNQGDVYTLITTTGALSGTFSDAPDGQVLGLFCVPTGGGSTPYLRINYTAHSVTATVVPPPPPPPTSSSPPMIAGTPQVGQTLTESHGTWTNNPTTFQYQWFDCDSSGANCMPVGSGQQTYSLTSSDLAHTIRVAETACNGTGCGGSISAPTATVTQPPTPAPTPTPTPTPTPAASAPSLSAAVPSVTATGVALSDSVNPDLLATTAHYEYGLAPSYRGGGAVVYDQRTPDQSVGSDNASHAVPAQLTGLVPNALYHVRLVATNAAGTTDGPDQTFTTLSGPAPAPPVLGRSVDAAVVSGLVFVKLPAGGPSLPATPLSSTIGPGFAPLTEARALPVGTQIDARLGSLRLVAASVHGGKTATGVFGGALFSVAQARSGLTTLALLEGLFPGGPTYGVCAARSRDAAQRGRAAALSARTLQVLRSSVHGSFSTRGRYGAATVRGTVWDTADRCNGTLVTVHRGTVLVRDFRRRITVVVHAGQHYLARAR
jgi:hypothetical protein